jgi:hypothetical protein
MAIAWSSRYGRRNPIRRSVPVATRVAGETVTLSVLRRVGEPAVDKFVRDSEQVSVNALTRRRILRRAATQAVFGSP